MMAPSSRTPTPAPVPSSAIPNTTSALSQWTPHSSTNPFQFPHKQCPPNSPTSPGLPGPPTPSPGPAPQGTRDPRTGCASLWCLCARGRCLYLPRCAGVLEYQDRGQAPQELTRALGMELGPSLWDTLGAWHGHMGSWGAVRGTHTSPGEIPAQIPPNSQWKFTLVCANTEKSQSLQVNKHRAKIPWGLITQH